MISPMFSNIFGDCFFPGRWVFLSHSPRYQSFSNCAFNKLTTQPSSRFDLVVLWISYIKCYIAIPASGNKLLFIFVKGKILIVMAIFSFCHYPKAIHLY